MSEMTDATALALRKPFPPESVGKLPKPTAKDNQRGKCGECGGWHGLPAVHLDYVGHAAVTDRLLTVDPSWTWRPFSGEEIAALPPSLRDGGLWIMLTVCGVTKPGFGDAQGKSGGNAVKEMIGDAIRNAAMRFGVSLDLWAKENLVEFAQAVHERETQAKPVEQHTATPPQATPSTGEPVLLNTSSKLARAMYAAINEAGITEAERLPYIASVIGREISSSKEMFEDDARLVLRALDSGADA